MFGLVSDIAEAYSELNIGPFDNEAFQAAIHNPSAIRDKVMGTVGQALALAPFKAKNLRQEMTEDAEALLSDLYKAVTVLRQAGQSPGSIPLIFPLSSITINEEGSPEINGQNQEKLKEQYCRIYLESPEEKALYLKLKELEKAYNGVQEEFNKHRFIGQLGVHPTIDTLVLDSQNMATLKPEATKMLVQRYQANRY